MLARKAYLENQWLRYPTRPKTHNQSGRVVSCANGRLELQIGPGQIASFELGPELSDWPSRLICDDWISLLAEGGTARELCLLAPCLSVNPPKSITAEKLQLIQRWTEFLQFVREFFIEREFVEIQTPTLVTCPGTEPYLDVFSTEFKQGKSQQKLFLPTSPELHLKKTLALGVPKIFEIRPCFRNGEVSATHQPEFWMLEWYRSFEDLSAIKQDVENLVHFLIQKMQLPLSFSRPQSASLRDLFAEHCGFHLQPQTKPEQLFDLAQRLKMDLGQSYSGKDSFDDLFFLLFLEKIEGGLESRGPVFVEKYPPSQAALARLTKDGWGDRFEFYWQGFEIANAFHELNDPVIQRQRMQEDLAKKMELNKESVALDEEFLQALESGLPPSAGIALGLERLFLSLQFANQKKPDLGQLRLFPRE